MSNQNPTVRKRWYETSNDYHLAVDRSSFFNQTNENLPYFPTIYNQVCVRMDPVVVID